MNKNHIENIEDIEKALKISFLHPNNLKKELFQDTMETLSNIMSETKDDIVFCRSVKVIILLSKTDPNYVENYFKTIAKITINWLRDINSSCQVVEVVNYLLKVFSIFWRKYIEFTQNILRNLMDELNLLNEDYKTLEETEDFMKMIDQKDRIICVFCIFSILIESIGNFLDDTEFKNFLLSDDIFETIKRGVLIQEEFKDNISVNIGYKIEKPLEKKQKKLTKNFSLPSDLRI